MMLVLLVGRLRGNKMLVHWGTPALQEYPGNDHPLMITIGDHYWGDCGDRARVELFCVVPTACFICVVLMLSSAILRERHDHD